MVEMLHQPWGHPAAIAATLHQPWDLPVAMVVPIAQASQGAKITPNRLASQTRIVIGTQAVAAAVAAPIAQAR